MRGTIRTNRCEGCRLRKVKCDECWPTCGRCRKRGITCSGPPATFTHFIVHQKDTELADGESGHVPDGWHNDDETLDSLRDVVETSLVVRPGVTDNSNSAPIRLVLVETHQRNARTGTGLFTRLRAKPSLLPPSSAPSPRSLTPDPAPLLSSDATLSAGRLICILEASDTNLVHASVKVRSSWLHLLPARMSDSRVLCDAVDLFATTAVHSQVPGSPPTSSLDAATYLRTVRSLRKAVSQNQTAYTTETMAAVALVHLAEDEYNRVLGHRQQNNKHASGLQSLMSARGPPVNVYDELEMLIVFETMSNLLNHFIVDGNTHDFYRPEWTQAMQRAVDAGTISQRWDEYLNCQLLMCITWWPHLATSLKKLHLQPDDAELATSIIQGASKVVKTLAGFDRKYIQPLLQDSTKTWTLVDVTSPGGGFAYGFDVWDTFQVVVSHAMISIAVNQILLTTMTLHNKEVDVEADSPPDNTLTLRQRLGQLCGRLWRSIPYAMQAKDMKGMALLTPLILSLEYADSGNRRALVENIFALSGHARKVTYEAGWAHMYGVCRTLTGRPKVGDTGSTRSAS